MMRKEDSVEGILSWCERRDLNPYVVNTRPSNVRVCRFRHSRISSCSLGTLPIIANQSAVVKCFFKVFSNFFNYLLLFQNSIITRLETYVQSNRKRLPPTPQRLVSKPIQSRYFFCYFSENRRATDCTFTTVFF